MSFDIYDSQAGLNRRKVRAELEELFKKLPIPDTEICKSATASVREEVLSLTDEVAEAAYAEGMNFRLEISYGAS